MLSANFCVYTCFSGESPLSSFLKDESQNSPYRMGKKNKVRSTAAVRRYEGNGRVQPLPLVLLES